MTDRAAPRTEATAEQQLFDLIEPLMPFTNAEAVRRAVREVIAETRREAAAPAPDRREAAAPGAGLRYVGKIVIDDRPHCPTCGHLANVQEGDEGQKFWEPDERDVIQEAAAPGAAAPAIDAEWLAVLMAEEGFAVPATNRDEQWDAPYAEAARIVARLLGARAAEPKPPESPR